MKFNLKRLLSVSLCAFTLVCKIHADSVIWGNTYDQGIVKLILSDSNNQITVTNPGFSFVRETNTDANDRTYGYGLAFGGFALSSNVFYTYLHEDVFIPATSIYSVGVHVMGPSSTNADFIIPNPDPKFGIQSLATYKDNLYMMTGYILDNPKIWRWPFFHPPTHPPFPIVDVDGSNVSYPTWPIPIKEVPGPIVLSSPAYDHTNFGGPGGSPWSFTVLTNGDFLVPDCAGFPIYREYDSHGRLKPGGLTVDVTNLVPTAGQGWGVCVGTNSGAPALFFGIDNSIIAVTDLRGNLINTYQAGGPLNIIGLAGGASLGGQPQIPSLSPRGRSSLPVYAGYTAAPSTSSTLVNAQRSQQVYNSSQFPGPVIITALHFRPAEVPSGSAFYTTISNIQINLSTTTNSHDGLSTTFSDNTGSDDTIVYSGPLPITSTYTGPAAGPRDTDIVIPLQAPFTYDPTNGNLLLDIRHFSDDSGNGAYISAVSSTNDTGSRVISTDPNSATADSSDSTVDVVDFSYYGADSCFAPNYAAYTTTSGASGTLINAQRSQQVYQSLQFPSDPVYITELRFRPAEAPYGSAFSTTISNIQINLSTTSHSPDGLSTTFADNVGSDDTIVYSGSLDISSAYTGKDGSGPRDNDIVIKLQTPFLYYRTNGNLLLDIRHFSDDSGNGAFTECFGESNDGGSRIVSLDPNSSMAGWADTGIDAVNFIYEGAGVSAAPNYSAYKSSSDASDTFIDALRSQQVYQYSQFPAGPILITELRFRPAGAPYGNAFVTTITNIQISLSTTTNFPDRLSTTFANNVGTNNTVVYSGPLTISSADTGSDGGLRDNDIVIHLQTPFVYDSTLGNLLLDIRHFSSNSGNGAFTECSGQSQDAGSRIVSLDPNSPTAGWADTAVDVVKFIYSNE
jgi:hypothetical protein